MKIVMMRTELGEDCTPWRAGLTYEASAEFADYLFAQGAAYEAASGYKQMPKLQADAVMENATQTSGLSTRFPQRPYRVASFGDSRSNTNAAHLDSGTNKVLRNEVVIGALVALRPDMLYVFNGGVSGTTAANWDNDIGGRVTANKTVQDMLATMPDLCVMQYGINDIIGWNGSSPTKSGKTAALIDALKACCATIMGAGVYVAFESINPCAKASVSYINGYSSAGGYGANHADKNDILEAVNAEMKAWLTVRPQMGVFVDTSSATTAPDGYAKQDGTYRDGTHLSAYGAVAAAKIVDATIRQVVPVRDIWALNSASLSQSAVNGALLSPTGGLADKWAIEAGAGTWAADVKSIDGDTQEIVMTCTALASGIASRTVKLVPSFIGANTKPVVNAGDVLAARFELSVDDGAGGRPACYVVYARQRLFYSDATNEYMSSFQPDALVSTDFPRMEPGTFYVTLPTLTVKAGMDNAAIQSTSGLFVVVVCNVIGTVRLRIRNAAWRVVT